MNHIIAKEGDYLLIADRMNNFLIGKIVKGYGRYKYTIIDEKREGWDFDELSIEYFRSDNLFYAKKLTKAEFDKLSKLTLAQRTKYITPIIRKTVINKSVFRYSVVKWDEYYIFGCGAIVLTEKDFSILEKGWTAMLNIKVPAGFKELIEEIEDQDGIERNSPQVFLNELKKIKS